MTVVRYRTILDQVLRRGTIIDEVVARLLHTYREPRRRTMSYEVVRDVVRHRTIMLGYPTLTRIAASFLILNHTTITQHHTIIAQPCGCRAMSLIYIVR